MRAEINSKEAHLNCVASGEARLYTVLGGIDFFFERTWIMRLPRAIVARVDEFYS